MLRASLGAVYLAAFLSLAVQLADLAGSRGLLPVAEHLDRLRGAGIGLFARLHAFPTVLWIHAGDAAIRLLAYAGAALSLVYIAGRGGRAVPAILWVLYLSGITAGRDFFYYQWDNLLLEAGLLAIVLPARGSILDLVRGRPLPEPSPAVIFLFRWLLFRLLFESGLAKLVYGREDWFDLNGMTFYYETAPLPSWGGWLVQQWPGWFHRMSTWFMLLVELVLPLFAFGPRSMRRVLFAGNLAFQIAIATTSNYGFFNLLSLVISLAVLDDLDLRWFGAQARRLPSPRRGTPRPEADAAGGEPAPPAAASPAPAAGRALVMRRAAWAFAGLVVFASLVEATTYFWRGSPAARSLQALSRIWDPLRCVNRYHLFPGIVRRRIVREIEGTADGRTWTIYRMRYAPGDPRDAPPTTWLHNPRFPFTYSFVTLRRGGRDAEYLSNLVRRLCCDPAAVADLSEPLPFDGGRPLGLRVRDYHYRFGTWDDLARSGQYWLVEPQGPYSRAIACRCDGAR